LRVTGPEAPFANHDSPWETGINRAVNHIIFGIKIKLEVNRKFAVDGRLEMALGLRCMDAPWKI
jgi:hypothetical protein